jgi:osmotically-inducible protein OsmY
MRVVGLTVLMAALAVACRRGEAHDRMGSTESQALDPPDARLARQVNTKLVGDPRLPDASSILVSVDGGRVTLEGWVDSVNVRTLAEADAATVAGVVSVDNRLLIRQRKEP